MTKFFSLKDLTQKFKPGQKAAMLFAVLAATSSLASPDPIAQIAMTATQGSEINYFLRDGAKYKSTMPEVKPAPKAKLLRTLPAGKTDDKSQARIAHAQWIVKSTKNRVSLSKAQKIVDAVYTYTKDTNIEPTFILGMIRAESHFNHKASNSYGARGLMQVVPRWHRDKLKGQDPFDVYVNVRVGVQVYEDCLEKFKSEKRALSCYSGGAGAHYQKRIAQTKSDLSTHARGFVEPAPSVQSDPLYDFIKDLIDKDEVVATLHQ